jgi:hypothetical protein
MAKLCSLGATPGRTSRLIVATIFSYNFIMEKIKPYELTEQEQQEYQEYEKDMQDQLLEDVAESQS